MLVSGGERFVTIILLFERFNFDFHHFQESLAHLLIRSEQAADVLHVLAFIIEDFGAVELCPFQTIAAMRSPGEKVPMRMPTNDMVSSRVLRLN